ncbi:MAG: histidine--tRNA ligase [Armatimonadota bacterium]|nr:histidine--tRNA ligase [Armatimonadota bacterium]MDR7495087.1 histidine--tRNA ligase [Armatimonadota bacterium]MDR7572900.1 histidine--tRNA ligase [Armatimonadota bacterium]
MTGKGDLQAVMKAPRGMHDILPEEVGRWQALEAYIRAFAARYGYQEIRTPVVEHTEVFQRTSGETSDIVEKEMYTFTDRGGRSLSLRPEGTAGVVRAYLEHGMAARPQPVRLYYLAAMFRYDRPQKGRYRMHHQFGAEIIGSDAPEADVEVLSLPIRLVQSLGLTETVVRLNSVGDPACRPQYLEALRRHFRPRRDRLSPDSQRRLETNPMRILESKDPRDREAAEGAPVMLEFLCPACRGHFDRVKQLFTAIGIPYVEDPFIVRGLDYYTRTAAEIHSGRLGGAQHQVLGGGRYDGLAEQLGGPHVPGVGFGLGLDRLLLVLEAEHLSVPDLGIRAGLDAFVAAAGDGTAEAAFRLLDALRAAGVRAVGEMAGRSLRAQMKSADRLGARFTVIVGTQEVAAGRAGVRDMRTGEQTEVAFGEVPAYLSARISRD